MDLVDDVDLICGSRRSKINFLKDRPDVVDTIVGSGVHLGNVKDGTVQDTLTCGAFVAWITVYGILAVDRACEYLRNGGLTRTVLTAEKICMSKLFCNY